MKKKDNWNLLIEQSAREGADERISALRTALTWLRQALNVYTQADTETPLLERLELVRSSNEGLALPSKESLELALETIINLNTDNVPDQENCVKSVSVLKQFWLTLRKNFISHNNAKAICRNIVQKEHIIKVSIFGSLARDKAGPNDIDILVFDDGTYSSLLEGSTDPSAFRVKQRAELAIKLIGVDSIQNRELINCGWVDILLYNGTLFGPNYQYNNFIMSKQADPYFFLNIASDVKDYDYDRDDFIETDIALFRYLGMIKTVLKDIGFNDKRVSEQDYYL